MSAQVDYLERPATGDPAGALFLFHGRGADEHDLFPLFDMLDPDRRLQGIAPGGLLALPPGGRHWYAVYRIGYPDKDTFDETFVTISSWLDKTLADLGISHDRTVIGGFSQGAVMSHALSLAKDRPRPAGLLAMSGFIPTVEGFDLDMSKAEGLPVAITHGTYDPVIQVGFGRDAKQRLEEAGAEVLYREAPVDHTIDPRVIPELTAWLARTISS